MNKEELNEKLTAKGKEHRDTLVGELQAKGLTEMQAGGIADLARSIRMVHNCIKTMATPGIHPAHKIQLASQMNPQIVEMVMSGAAALLIGELGEGEDPIEAANHAGELFVHALESTQKLDEGLTKMVTMANAKPGIVGLDGAPLKKG